MVMRKIGDQNNRRWILAIGLAWVQGGCVVGQVELEVFLDGDGDGVGLEDDCDPQDPEVGSGRTWYLDQDGDGFGDAGQETSAGCEGPALHVAQSGDCDDTNTTQYPGATEICDDQIVQNCTGTEWDAQMECLQHGEGSLNDADATLTGEENDHAGSQISTGGDLNGDTVEDMLVAAPGLGVGRHDRGVVYVVFGLVSGQHTLSEATAKILAEDRGDGAACSISGGSDVSGDSLADIIIGATSQDAGGSEAGAVYLVLGPVTDELSLSEADAKFVGEAPLDIVGVSVSMAGDVDGDGYADMLAGAPYLNEIGTFAGAVYLMSGPSEGDRTLSEANAKLLGEEVGDYAGWAVSTASDVNGDGLADLLIGAPTASSLSDDAGSAYLLLGPVSGQQSLQDADAKLIGEEEGDDAGTSVSTAGDVNGDGLADLLIGAPGSYTGGASAGATYVVLTPISGQHYFSGSEAKLIGDEGLDYAGQSVSTAGDVNGDSLSDLLVGAPQPHNDGDAGIVYIVPSPVIGVNSLSDVGAKLVGNVPGGQAGGAVSAAGDVNNDGLADILIGAPEAGDNAGAAYLLLSHNF